MPRATVAAAQPWRHSLDEVRTPQLVRLGVCRACGAWLKVLPNGTLPVHVNWPHRQAGQGAEKE